MPLTCKDCPYWDRSEGLSATYGYGKSVGLCRINPVGANAGHAGRFPCSMETDWCHAIRPELERELKKITTAAREAQLVDHFSVLDWRVSRHSRDVCRSSRGQRRHKLSPRS